MPPPARMHNQIHITGGFIQKDWAPDLCLEDGKPYMGEGRPFMKLRTGRNPGLSHLIGLGDGMNGELPRQFLDYFAEARNEQVTLLLNQKRHEEVQASNSMSLTTSRRAWIDLRSSTRPNTGNIGII